MNAANEKCRPFKEKYDACFIELSRKETIVASFFNLVDPKLNNGTQGVSDRCEAVFEDYKLCTEAMMKQTIESRKAR